MANPLIYTMSSDVLGIDQPLPSWMKFHVQEKKSWMKLHVQEKKRPVSLRYQYPNQRGSITIEPPDGISFWEISRSSSSWICKFRYPFRNGYFKMYIA
jgi:hypothetical protein